MTRREVETVLTEMMTTAAAAAAAAAVTMVNAMQRTKRSKPDRDDAGEEVECLRTPKDSERDHYVAHDRGNIVGNPDSSNTSRIGRKHPRPSFLARLLQCQPWSWGRMAGRTRPLALLTGYPRE